MNSGKTTLLLSALLALVAPGAIPALGQTRPAPKRRVTPAVSRTSHMTMDSALLHPASLQEHASEVYRVRFVTTKGDFVVEVARSWAPLGADRFYNLVKRHFYDGASFFRVLKRFVVQFGISANPQVSRAWRAATFKDDPVKKSNLRGFLSFATAGPNTRTTQVFINLGDNHTLDSMGFSPFGKVVEGMDVVDQLYSGYGEGAPQGNGPRQDLLEARGKEYIEKNFPKLDSIKTAILMPGNSAGAASISHPPSARP